MSGSVRDVKRGDFRPACLFGDALPDQSPCPARIFAGEPGRVRAVRKFVEAQFSGHPALESAVLVASELAANSVRHSLRGRDGGRFLVHLAALDQMHAGVMVTDEGGPDVPGMTDAGGDAESGRGLAVVRALTSLFRVYDAAGLRSYLAVVPGQQTAQHLPAGLVTAGADPHAVTAECSLACPRGLLSAYSMERLRLGAHLAGPGGVGKLAELYLDGGLAEIRGVGPVRVTEIAALLRAAGLIGKTTALGNRALPSSVIPVDGTLIRELRESRGYSQSALARIARLSTATVARLEADSTPYCHRYTLNRIATALKEPRRNLVRDAIAGGKE